MLAVADEQHLRLAVLEDAADGVGNLGRQHDALARLRRADGLERIRKAVSLNRDGDHFTCAAAGAAALWWLFRRNSAATNASSSRRASAPIAAAMYVPSMIRRTKAGAAV